jgi:hypothetical protein
MAQSLNLLPFLCRGPFATIALPALRRSSGGWDILEPGEIRTLGFRQSALRFERINDAIAKSKAGKPLADRVNERNKLAIQEFPKDHYLVLSGAGGGISCGACLPVNKCKDIVIDQTLYWRLVPTRTGAWYRVGFLNSDAITNAIKLFNPEGEFGARHAHTLPHRFIPPFDQDNKTHVKIAQLAEAISKRASEAILQYPELGDPNRMIAARRRKLRSVLRGMPEFRELEDICESVLRAQSSRKPAK